MVALTQMNCFYAQWCCCWIADMSKNHEIAHISTRLNGSLEDIGKVPIDLIITKFRMKMVQIKPEPSEISGNQHGDSHNFYNFSLCRTDLSHFTVCIPRLLTWLLRPNSCYENG